MPHFDPRSNDSLFSTIIYRLDAQDLVLREIRDEVRKTNGRVTMLEQARKIGKAKLGVIFAIVSPIAAAAGWCLNHYFK